MGVCEHDPRDCSYKLDLTIKRDLRRVLVSKQTDRSTKAAIKKLLEAPAKSNLFSYNTITDLHKYLQRADKDFNEYFYEFLAKCTCIPPKPRQNAALEERLKQLKLEQSKTEYDRMTSVFHPNRSSKTADRNADPKDDGTIGHDIKALRASLIAVVNSFLVIICTFIFCYKAVEYSLHEPHIPAQVLFGVIGSTVVALAELYFIVRVM